MDINERFLKLSGKIGPLPPGLINDEEDIKIILHGIPFEFAHAKTEHHNNQDGTFDEIKVYKQV